MRKCKLSSEEIEYRGEKIDIGKIREWVANAKNGDGTPYFSSEEAEAWIRREILLRKREIGRLTGARFDKNQGFHLVFYAKERQMFPKAFETKVTDHEATLLVRKLFRHFGNKYSAKHLTVRFFGNRQSGNAGGWRGMRLSHNPNIGLICHEVAHYFHKKHDRKLMKWIQKMIRYCEKKGWLNGKAL